MQASITPVVTPPKPKGPSERAAAIIAVNALRSKCPTRDTMPKTKPIAYAVLVDSVKDMKKGDKLTVNYDVCGLSKNSPFSAALTLTKLNQSGFLGMGKQAPQRENVIETAGSPRSREKATVDLARLSAGTYRLDVVVTDARKRVMGASRQFQIFDK